MKTNPSDRPMTRSYVNDVIRGAIREKYELALSEFHLALYEDPVDWRHLFRIHCRLVVMERSCPVLRKQKERAR